MRHLLRLIQLMLAAGSITVPAATTPQPVITYTNDGVTVSGVSAGGQVILFGISRNLLGVATHTAR